MIDIARYSDENFKNWRSFILGIAVLLAAAITVTLSNPVDVATLLQSQSTPQTPILRTVGRDLISAKKAEPVTGLNAKAATTKLEWQQGWQPNAWQLQDGDWPDEGGRFSEGQTYPEDPATFKIHQTYAFAPGHGRLSKSEAEAYWTDMQKRFFRQTPSRTTYPAVPVIFDEDDNGGHSHVAPLIHKTDEIYINSQHYPSFPVHFKSTAKHQSLFQMDPETSRKNSSKDDLQKEYLDSEKQNEILEHELAVVEKGENLAPVVAAPNNNYAESVDASLPFNINHDAGETEDWKEALFMQGALYEMQRKLAEQEDENQDLRRQLTLWKSKALSKSQATLGKVNSFKPAVSVSSSEKDQISEMRSLIANIQQQQKKTELENSRLREQLGAIK